MDEDAKRGLRLANGGFVRTTYTGELHSFWATIACAVAHTATNNLFRGCAVERIVKTNRGGDGNPQKSHNLQGTALFSP